MSKTPRTDDREFAAMELKPSSRVVYASLARQLEAELADKDKQLAEAKAEIERLKSEHEDSLRRAKNNAVSLSGAVTKYAGELFVKDKLIEQMREALKLADDLIDEYAADYEHRDNVDEIRDEIKAALAAEEGSMSKTPEFKQFDAVLQSITGGTNE